MEMEQLNFERDLALNNIEKIVDCSNNLAEFRVRVKELNSIKKSFLQTQAKIEKISAKNETFSKTDNLAIRNKFDSLYFQVQVTLDAIKKERKQSVSAPCGGHNVSHAGCCASQQVTQSHIRLPQLTLQTFSGDLTEWNAFYDLFKSLVHDNATLTDVERFRYLLLFLKGEPYNLIKSIPVTEYNYENALQVLISRYENKRIIATTHFDNIFDVEAVSDKNIEFTLRNLMNCYHENITALKSLGMPVEQWSFVLLNILLRKITPNVRRRFELSLKISNEIPSVTDLLDFLDKELAASEIMHASARTSSTYSAPAPAQRATGLAGGLAGSARPPAVTSSRHAQAGRQAISLTRAHSDVQYNAPRTPNTSFARNSRTMSMHAATAVDYLNKIKCAYCKDNSHPLYKCEKFQTLTFIERKHFVHQNKICYNCLFIGHDAKDCKSRHSCRACSQRHHSSLHEDAPTSNVTLTTEYSPSPELHSVADTFTPTPLHGATGFSSSKNCTVLLTTALVNVRPMNHGPYSPRSVRALVDQGSQATLITESCVQRLGLPRYPAQTSTTVTGIGDSNEQPRGYVLCEVTPHNKPEPKLYIEALILPKITSYLPSIPNTFENIEHLQGLNLADPELRSARPVELLLGSDYSDSILLHDNIKGPQGTPVAINSIFGYLLNGRIAHEDTRHLSTNLSTRQLDIKLQRFWELESIPEHPHLTKDELRCESIFVDTHTRDSNGKYTVSLPFKENAPPLGESRSIALSRLTKLEARLSRDPALRENYNKCLQEYLDLGHMEPVSDSANSDAPPYHIPHHCVVKKSAATSKYRIVFDASCRTTSGRSLNDNLLTGQKLQQDICEILLKYRLHKIVFTADLKMMYRYIGLCKEHRDFHRILWRFSPHDPVQEYRLCCVTFGVSAAPFLALRTLRQLATDEADAFPLASQILLNEVFVDDVVTGADTVEDALILQRQLTSICKAGTFELRKWTSNSSEFLSHLSTEDSNHDDALILSALDTDASVKVLGLKWNPKSDTFTYQTDGLASGKCTKRIMLGEIAKIYDPLGFLSPVTLFAKHLIQLLWVSGTSWDETPPQGVCDLWYRFIDELPLLQDISLPRHVLPSTHQVQLCGFSDASEKAYAACVYIRVVDSEGAVSTHLLMGKTKVAPLKRLTIARLELCGAHLLSKLIRKLLTAYSSVLSFDQVHAWCDSTITLAWLRSSPDKWRTYVSNRIAETTSNVPASHWQHVQSTDNPADPASRGVLPSQLNHQLWFKGPAWLSKNESEWPISKVNCHTDEERRKHVLLTQTNEPSSEFLERFSSLPRMLRVVSLMLRFINKCRKTNVYSTDYITVPETKLALSRTISLVQREQFSEDISRLKDDDKCTTRLQKLKPFLDDTGLLRVGGRIDRANVPKFIPLHIIEEDSYEKDVLFYVNLGNPELVGDNDNPVYNEANHLATLPEEEAAVAMMGLPRAGEITRAQLRVKESKEFKNTVDKLVQRANASIIIGTSSWKEQFSEALTVSSGSDDPEQPPSVSDYILHIVTLFWKIIFALIPPTDIGGGYVCFVISIVCIGLVTAVIGDVASHFGCTLGIKDSVTAIVFVALGTSIPDTFASKVAAIQDKYADASVGNVTGSNAVNVFLGIGVAWTVAAIVHWSKDEKFLVDPGNLAFSVTMFCSEASLVVLVLVLRRRKSVGGELGGPRGIKICTSIFFFSLWLVYLTMSTLEAYDVIPGF